MHTNKWEDVLYELLSGHVVPVSSKHQYAVIGNTGPMRQNIFERRLRRQLFVVQLERRSEQLPQRRRPVEPVLI